MRGVASAQSRLVATRASSHRQQARRAVRAVRHILPAQPAAPLRAPPAAARAAAAPASSAPPCAAAPCACGTRSGTPCRLGEGRGGRSVLAAAGGGGGCGGGGEACSSPAGVGPESATLDHSANTAHWTGSTPSKPAATRPPATLVRLGIEHHLQRRVPLLVLGHVVDGRPVAGEPHRSLLLAPLSLHAAGLSGREMVCVRVLCVAEQARRHMHACMWRRRCRHRPRCAATEARPPHDV